MYTKRILLMSSICLVFVSSLFFYYRLRTSKRLNDALVDPVKTHVLIPEYVSGNLLVVANKNVFENTMFPSSLPIINFRHKDISREHFKTISRNLEFDGEPSVAQDVVEGEKLVWSNTSASLWITPSKSLINYHLNKFTKALISTTRQEDELKQGALNFLIEKIGLNKDDFKFESVEYFSQSLNPEAGFKHSQKETADFYQFNFTYNPIGLPVFTNTPSLQIIFVRMLTTGKVFQAKIYFLEKISATNEKYVIKTNEEIKASLPLAKILETENDYISLHDITSKQIENISIDKITLGYFFDETSITNQFKPVFKLEGEIKIQNSRASRARLLLPAYK